MNLRTDDSLKSKIALDSLVVNFASTCSQILIFVQTVLVMRMLNPELYGIWIGLNIMLSYSGFANLGLEYIFSIRFPYYQGKRDYEKCRSIADTVYFFWTVATVLYVLGIFVYVLIEPQTSRIVFWGLIAIAVLIITEQQTTFYNRWITSGEKIFSVPSYISIARNVASFFIIVPLVYFYSIEGLICGSVFISVAVLILWNYKTSFKFKWQPSLATLKEMMVIGIPSFAITLVNTFARTADRLFVIAFLGATALGYYGIVAMGSSFLYVLLAQAAGVMVPHMVEHMGKNNDLPQCLEKYLIRPTLIFAYASSVFLVFCFFVIPLAVELVLPQYIPGLPAFYAFLPGFFFLSIMLSANNILYLILIPRKKQRYILYLQIVAVVIQIVASMLFIHYECGLVGIAFSATMASGILGGTMLWLAVKYVVPEKRKRFMFMENVFRPFLCVLLCVPVIYWLKSQLEFSNTLVDVTLRLISCIIIVIPLLYSMNLKTNVVSLIHPVLVRLKSSLCHGSC